MSTRRSSVDDLGAPGSRPAPALQLAAALQLRFDRRIRLFAIGDRVIAELRGQRSPLLPGQRDPVAGNGDSRACFGSFGTARTPSRRRRSDRLVDDDLLSSGMCCHAIVDAVVGKDLEFVVFLGQFHGTAFFQQRLGGRQEVLRDARLDQRLPVRPSSTSVLRSVPSSFEMRAWRLSSSALCFFSRSVRCFSRRSSIFGGSLPSAVVFSVS